MKSFKFLSFTLLFLMLWLPAAASDRSGLIVGLDTIPRRVSADNPSLAAARWKIAEAEARLRGAGLRENPELEFGFDQASSLQERGLEIGISQRFPVTEKLALEKRVSSTLLLQAKAEIQEVERALILEARTLIIEIISLRHQQALRARQAEVAQSLGGFIAEAASRGELSSLDAAQAKLDAAKLKAEIPTLRAAEITATGKVKPLLGMEPSDTLRIAGQQLAAPALQKGRVNLANRPAYQASLFAAQASAENIELQKARRYDDIELGVVAGYERFEDAPEGLENEATIGFRVKLALPFWQKNEAAIEEAQARTNRKTLESQALAKEIINEAEAAYQEMTTWAGLLQELDQSLLAEAGKLASDSEDAYRKGLGDLQATLRAREQQLDLSNTRIETLKQFHLARVRYEAAAGLN